MQDQTARRRRTPSEDDGHLYLFITLYFGYKDSKNLYSPKTSIFWKQPNKLITIVPYIPELVYFHDLSFGLEIN